MVFRGKNVEPNWLVLNIQPDEGISLSFGAKPPGANLDIHPVRMDFQYREFFGPSSRDAYSALLNDCMRGDATLFDRADSVEAAWALIDPIRAGVGSNGAAGLSKLCVGELGAAGGHRFAGL